MNFKALLKSNKKLIFKFCLLIGCFLIMTLFIFNNESFYKRTIINITYISTSNAGVNTSPTNKTENTFVTAASVIIHQSIFKFDPQIILIFFFNFQLPLFSIYLTDQNQNLFFIHQIPVVKDILR